MLSAPRVLFGLFAVLLSLFSLARALPLALQPRDVWAPRVTYPVFGTVWSVGERYNVTWDLTSEPKQITNPTGQIWLRKDGLTLSQGPGSTQDPLASGFNLTDGHVEITVPDIAPDSDYELVLFGDSGNFSPNFTISAASSA
ncbi:hypothetical protein DFH11DRAFT_1880544 [Phellopilus nigrolimitatus]|nr:hypothetical protein DFH11DRAFT_1880544 [Phellopilus nigrolimitatus]